MDILSKLNEDSILTLTLTAEENISERTTFKRSRSWVSPLYFADKRGLLGEFFVLVYFLFVSIYTYLLSFQFSFVENKQRWA